MTSRVLVTGGAGFIGSHVVDALVERGREVRVVDSLHPRAHTGKPDYLRSDVEYVFGDLTDSEVARRAVEGVDAVCHQASMVGLGVDFADVTDYVEANDVATARLLGVLDDTSFDGRLVLGSSMVVYGEGAYDCARCGRARPAPRAPAELEAGRFEPPCPHCGGELEAALVSEDVPLDPRNVYAATKLHQEHLCRIFGITHRAPVTLLRYHNVYGPRMPRNTPYSGVAAIFRSALEDRVAPRVFEDGGQRRDFVHVRDVAEANVLALTSAEPVDGPLNVASGTPHTVLEMADALCDAFGPDAPRPEVVGGWRDGDVRHVTASTARIEQTLGYRASVDLADGMAEFAHAPLREPLS